MCGGEGGALQYGRSLAPCENVPISVVHAIIPPIPVVHALILQPVPFCNFRTQLFCDLVRSLLTGIPLPSSPPPLPS